MRQVDVLVVQSHRIDQKCVPLDSTHHDESIDMNLSHWDLINVIEKTLTHNHNLLPPWNTNFL